MLIALSNVVFAQKDVTKFLGIPVDGTKEEMIQKLKAKGFRSSSYDREVLEGEFNGRNVQIYIVTNNNKVYRIMVCDANKVREREIQIRFNTLCLQFKNNEKYLSFDNYFIPDDEDISYEMLVHKKRYEAIFYQNPDMTDTLAIRNTIRPILLSKYTEDELNSPPEELLDIIQSDTDILEMVMEHITKKSVWFMINRHLGEYYIAMYYDNEYNKANGEDL